MSSPTTRFPAASTTSTCRSACATRIAGSASRELTGEVGGVSGRAPTRPARECEAFVSSVVGAEKQSGSFRSPTSEFAFSVLSQENVRCIGRPLIVSDNVRGLAMCGFRRW